MSTTNNQLLLGQSTVYPKDYSADILTAIARAEGRQQLACSLGISVAQLPLYQGLDIWQAYELSWLNAKGKPNVACARISVPAVSPNIVESKSLKLYLNSLNQHRFNDSQELVSTLQHDIGAVVGDTVSVELLGVDCDTNKKKIEGFLLDDLDIAIDCYQVNNEYLTTQSDLNNPQCTETLYSHLLRSSCPVTSQPDWGSVVISYSGKKINHEGLLRYIISFRNNQEFHEQCIERMFSDILLRCQPQVLTVSGIYLRRGGLDINPVRTTHPALIQPLPRICRQ